jgi:putative tryptophan/tyrosine transport system substrate-binding protein
MKRRELLGLLGGAVAWPMAAQAQQKERVRRIGIQMPFPKSDAAYQARVREFRQKLAGLGWSEGGNVQFEERWSTDNMDVIRADAASLVELNPTSF